MLPNSKNAILLLTSLDQSRSNFYIFPFRLDTGSRSGSQWQTREMFEKKAVLKDFAIFTGKHLCWSFFLIKLFPCEYCKYLRTIILKNIYKWLPLAVQNCTALFENVSQESINDFNSGKSQFAVSIIVLRSVNKRIEY